MHWMTSQMHNTERKSEKTGSEAIVVWLLGTLITMTGKLFTNRFESNVPASDNGLTEKLLR